MKYSYAYVSKLDKDTTTEDILNYLKNKGFDDIKCEKMNSKRPDIYASFRIGVPMQKFSDLNNPNIWPVARSLIVFSGRAGQQRMQSNQQRS